MTASFHRHSTYAVEWRFDGGNDMKSERLRKIEAGNAKLERETPFNFCDRWCERCIPEKQMRCKLYQDELEQKLACIAHGKDEHDPETTE